MRLLALETATLAGGAALLDDGRLVGESRLNIALTHSERLMAVDRLLQDCGWEMSTLRGLAVSIGPGSFTGLRVGAATARAWPGLDHPSRRSTLDALAATLPFADAPVLPAARRARARSARSTGGRRRDGRVWDYLALPPAEEAVHAPRPSIGAGVNVRTSTPFGTTSGGRRNSTKPL
jgi:tRNA threonylcarbamoyl adenosine modification protein YeaZ